MVAWATPVASTNRNGPYRDASSTLKATLRPRLYRSLSQRRMSKWLTRGTLQASRGPGAATTPSKKFLCPRASPTHSPTAEPLRGGFRFRPSVVPQVAPIHSGFAIGVGQSERSKSSLQSQDRSNASGAGKSVADRESFLRDLGVAQAALRAARLLCDGCDRPNGIPQSIG